VAATPESEVMANLEGLAKLRESGAITPEEYEAKKAELLTRI
jgi:Short C-terminal domain